jgi:hypothetical protein
MNKKIIFLALISLAFFTNSYAAENCKLEIHLPKDELPNGACGAAQRMNLLDLGFQMAAGSDADFGLEFLWKLQTLPSTNSQIPKDAEHVIVTVNLYKNRQLLKSIDLVPAELSIIENWSVSHFRHSEFGVKDTKILVDMLQQYGCVATPDPTPQP